MSKEKKQLDYKLTDKCAVCGHSLENPVFCQECGASHCAACWFLTGKCATYGCDNSDTYRPSVKEQSKTEQDRRNEQLFETLSIMRRRIDFLEKDLHDSRNLNAIKFRKTAFIIGTLAIVISFIVALIWTIPYILDHDSVSNLPVINSQQKTAKEIQQEKESFVVGRSYILDKDYIMWNNPVKYPRTQSRWGQKQLRSGYSIQILERHRTEWNQTWFKIQADGFYGHGWIVIIYE